MQISHSAFAIKNSVTLILTTFLCLLYCDNHFFVIIQESFGNGFPYLPKCSFPNVLKKKQLCTRKFPRILQPKRKSFSNVLTLKNFTRTIQYEKAYWLSEYSANWVKPYLAPGRGGGGHFYVRGWHFMTSPKIWWGIFWFVFCKHVLNTVVMVTTFS